MVDRGRRHRAVPAGPTLYWVRHRESGRVLAQRCFIGRTFWTRLRGWTGHRPAPDEALWLRPCGWIHTIGMRVAVDAIFCGRGGVVRRVVTRLRPGRVAGARGASDVCELPAGSAGGVAPGDHVDLVKTGL